MNRRNRRSFLKSMGIGIAASSAAISTVGYGQTRGANERVVVGVIGCGRGKQLGQTFQTLEGSTVSHVCDPDHHRAHDAKKATGAQHAVADLRRILDDKSVDAVVIASCDHWHAPAAILACQAGKHVYVEKPCSHNVHEGRLMIEAARKHDRVMQHGTQRRSSLNEQTAIQMLREGAIGDVLVAKHINSQRRSNIGRRKPSDPPSHLDYELWVGPAEWLPYQSNFVHYHWHWFYNFGTGDIGNDGVHSIDIARWGLGVQSHPSFVTGYGSKLFFDDDQQFPDTYTITFEYPGDGSVGSRRLLIYEQRIWSPYREDEDGNGIIFYGTKGMMKLGRTSIQVFGEDNKPIKCEQRDIPHSAHQKNFLDAIRDGTDLNAPIEVGHLSSTLAHLGNIVARLGRAVKFNPETEQILGDESANQLLRRKYRADHWARLDLS